LSVVDRAFKLFRRELEEFALHVPLERRSLKEVVESGKDAYLRTRSGVPYRIEYEDALALARDIPEEYHERVLLPIVLVRNVELGRGVFVVKGDEFTVFLVRKLAGLTREPFERWRESGEPNYVYKPNVFELLVKYGTSFVVSLETPEDVKKEFP